MPITAAEKPVAFGLLAHLEHLGHPLRADHTLIGVMMEQRPEAGGDIAQVAGRQILLVEYQHQMLGEGRPYHGQGFLVERAAQNDAAQDRAEMRRDRPQVRGGRGSFGGCFRHLSSSPKTLTPNIAFHIPCASSERCEVNAKRMTKSCRFACQSIVVIPCIYKRLV